MYILNIQFYGKKSVLADHVAEHTKWVKKSFLNKIFIIAGQKNDENGGVIVASNIGKKELNELIKQDPFVKNGLATYEITHFDPAFFQEELLNYMER